ncbi:hypothetical protein AU381_04340 [Sinorhizobium glycinis]|uniref:Uncharacterized protein n=2 Tax=Sinorhizobium glycinis TaxID=1472378 RepID=A0A178Y0X3_9HYPH|nr:hypothetical protein [Sinorhizobium glycinis]OAP41121.1 hypothetical protein AU381_04340 [Sinorhizobium glycinis]
MQNDDDKGRAPGPRSGAKAGKSEAEVRRQRLAKTLRDNLQRRKQQARARRAGDADETSGVPAAKSDESGD